MAESTGTTLGQALKNVMHGIASWLEGGSWHVEEAADKSRTAEMLLDRAEVEIDNDAQRTLDTINDALTSYHSMERNVAAKAAAVVDWQAKAEQAATQAKKYAEGTPERAKYINLGEQAMAEKVRLAALLVPLQKALDESKEANEKALDMVEQTGMSREIAKSTRERLTIAQASAETKLMLAKAAQGGGDLKGKALLAEAEAKIQALESSADAAQDITDRLPADADTVEVQLAMAGQKDQAAADFAELMGDTAATPAAS